MTTAWQLISEENLEKIGSWMKSNPDAKIQIQENTCNIGTAEYNLALGEQRATSANNLFGKARNRQRQAFYHQLWPGKAPGPKMGLKPIGR